MKKVFPLSKMKRLLDSVYSNVPDGGSSNGKDLSLAKAQKKRKVIASGKAPKSSQRDVATILRHDAAAGHQQHKSAHPNPRDFSDSCPRCRYLVHRQAWRDHIASIQLPGQKQLVWLNEKPARFCGSWGVGCDVCAAMLARLQNTGAEGLKLKRLFNAKWGRYEISSLSSVQASAIRLALLTKMLLTC